jgi:hypothetical protein
MAKVIYREGLLAGGTESDADLLCSGQGCLHPLPDLGASLFLSLKQVLRRPRGQWVWVTVPR